MDESQPSSPETQFVLEMKTRIRRHAQEHCTPFKSEPHLGRRTRAALERRVLASDPPLDSRVDRLVKQFLDEYPNGRRLQGTRLTFQQVYDGETADETEDETAVETVSVAKLLAAEIEFHGPRYLSHMQVGLLAEAYRRIGTELMTKRLPGHAVLAFRRAGRLFRQNDEAADAARCELALARAGQQALPLGLRRFGLRCADMVCGYGHQPFKILGWIAVQLVIFISIGLSENTKPNPQPRREVIYNGLTDFLNPVGWTDSFKPGNDVLFAVESWAGTVSTAVFFALLVRLWFRL